MVTNTKDSPTDATRPATSAPGRALWAERLGGPQYVGRNGRGAEVRIGSGDAEGVFSPGELLQLALAACTALSADHVLRSRLGEEFEALIGVSADKVADENRYGTLALELLLDRAELTEEQRSKLDERVRRTSGRQCTVGRTLEAGAQHSLRIVDEQLDAE